MTASGQYGFIEGKVYSALDDQPIPGVLLYTVPATYRVRTDSRGAYCLRVPAANHYEVFTNKPGFRNTSGRIVVQSHRQRRTCDFVLYGSTRPAQGSGSEPADGAHAQPGSAGFSGLVVGTDGVPLSGVRVTSSPASTTAQTDRFGVYFLAIDNPRGTSYRLRFSQGGFRPETAPMIFTPGMVRRCDAFLYRSNQPPRHQISLQSLGLRRGTVLRRPDLRTRHGSARPNRAHRVPAGRPRLG